jgi:hypothetical protein
MDFTMWRWQTTSGMNQSTGVTGVTGAPPLLQVEGAITAPLGWRWQTTWGVTWVTGVTGVIGVTGVTGVTGATEIKGKWKRTTIATGVWVVTRILPSGSRAIQTLGGIGVQILNPLTLRWKQMKKLD